MGNLVDGLLAFSFFFLLKPCDVNIFPIEISSKVCNFHLLFSKSFGEISFDGFLLILSLDEFSLISSEFFPNLFEFLFFLKSELSELPFFSKFLLPDGVEEFVLFFEIFESEAESVKLDFLFLEFSLSDCLFSH